MEPENINKNLVKKKRSQRKQYIKWNQNQQKRYLEFIIVNRKILDGKRITKDAAHLMKQHIGTVITNKQCIRKHLCMKFFYGSYDGVISKLTKKLQLHKKDVEWLSWAEEQKRKFYSDKGTKIPDISTRITKQSLLEEEAVKILLSNLDLKRIQFDNKTPKYELSNDLLINNENQECEVFDMQPQNILNYTPKKYHNFIDETKIGNKTQLCLEKKFQQHYTDELPQDERLTGNWNQIQKLRFLIFILKYQQTFRNRIKFFNREKPYVTNIFIKMSEFIQTKTRNQCTNKYNLLIRNFSNIDQGIQNFNDNIFANEKKIEKEIQRIESFYQNHQQTQFNAFNYAKYTRLEISEDNLSLLKSLLKQRFDKFIETQSIECSQNLSQESFFVSDEIEEKNIPQQDQVEMVQMSQTLPQSIECFQMQVPLFLELEFEELEINKNQDLDIFQIEKGISNKLENIKQLKQSERKDRDSEKSQQNLKEESSRSKDWLWSISQNVKFYTFLMTNRSLYQSKSECGAFKLTEISKFIGPSKVKEQCKDRFRHLLNKHNKNFSEIIKNEAERFGLSYDLIQLRKTLCQQTLQFKETFDSFNMIVQGIPTLVLIKENEFNPDKILGQILNMDFHFKVKACFPTNPLKKGLKRVEDWQQKINQSQQFLQGYSQEQKKNLQLNGLQKFQLSIQKNLIKAKMKFKISLSNYDNNQKEKLKEILRMKTIKIKINQIFKFYSY